MGFHTIIGICQIWPSSIDSRPSISHSDKLGASFFVSLLPCPYLTLSSSSVTSSEHFIESCRAWCMYSSNLLSSITSYRGLTGYSVSNLNYMFLTLSSIFNILATNFLNPPYLTLFFAGNNLYSSPIYLHNSSIFPPTQIQIATLPISACNKKSNLSNWNANS